MRGSADGPVLEGLRAALVGHGAGPPTGWDGALLLGDDGCAMYWTLVVTGIRRGQVWNVTDVGAQPFGRSVGYTTADDGFAGWAAHWAAGKDWFDVPS